MTPAGDLVVDIHGAHGIILFMESTLIEQKIKLENQLKSGASWFFWIAGFSLVNSIVLKFGGEWTFVVGLGVTQVIDAIAIALGAATIGKLIAFWMNLCVAGIFIFIGVLAKKRNRALFIIGMVLYAVDGLIFLLAVDVLSIAFHAFALFCIYSGFKADKELTKLEAQISATQASVQAPVQVMSEPVVIQPEPRFEPPAEQ